MIEIFTYEIITKNEMGQNTFETVNVFNQNELKQKVREISDLILRVELVGVKPVEEVEVI